MTKINDISQITVGCEIFDLEGELCHVSSIINNTIEPVIVVQHYPHTKWYVSEVTCDKCGAESKLKFTSTSAEKHICSNQIKVNDNFYTCGGKKYTEIRRRSTGIKCKGNFLWADFVKEFKLC